MGYKMGETKIRFWGGIYSHFVKLKISKSKIFALGPRNRKLRNYFVALIKGYPSVPNLYFSGAYKPQAPGKTIPAPTCTDQKKYFFCTPPWAILVRLSKFQLKKMILNFLRFAYTSFFR